MLIPKTMRQNRGLYPMREERGLGLPGKRR